MKPVAILDIGSSKVVCMIGNEAARGNIAVYGSGIAAYPGYEEGVFIDEKVLENAVISAVKDAEDMARYRIRDISVGVPAPFSKLALASASLKLGDEKRRITTDDVTAVDDSALGNTNAPGYILMSSTPVISRVDGVETPGTPVGLKATELGMTISYLFASVYFCSVLTRILKGLSIEVSSFSSAPFDESLLLISEPERIRPAILIDVGYLHTDIVIVENGALTNMTTLPMGGMQFASDLAYGLDIPLEYAEQVKRKYSFLQDEESDVETIHMPTGAKRVRRDVIDLIMEARAGELSELILKSLDQMGVRLENKPVTYLTGGGFSMMRGGGEYLRQTLGLRVKRDTPYIPNMQTPNYSSAFGVLDAILRDRIGYDEYIEEEPEKRGILSKIKNLFSK